MGRPPIHGMHKTPTYSSWKSMLARCLYPSHENYQYYGEKGIVVCQRWRNFANFYADMGDRPSIDHSIDRIETSGNYEPGNCKWSTKIEQQNNRPDNHLVEYRGSTMTMTEAWRLSGKIVAKSTLKTRLYKFGWPIKEALETPAVMGRNQWK